MAASGYPALVDASDHVPFADSAAPAPAPAIGTRAPVTAVLVENGLAAPAPSPAIGTRAPVTARGNRAPSGKCVD